MPGGRSHTRRFANEEYRAGVEDRPRVPFLVGVWAEGENYGMEMTLKSPGPGLPETGTRGWGRELRRTWSGLVASA